MPHLRQVTDFTYIRTKKGWLFAAIVLDLFSRRVSGWSLASRAISQLVVDALLMAVWRRQPKAPVLVDSDQSIQYSARGWPVFRIAHRLGVSMSRQGNCHDDAVEGSFFYDLKPEQVKIRSVPHGMKLSLIWCNTLKAMIIAKEDTETMGELLAKSSKITTLVSYRVSRELCPHQSQFVEVGNAVPPFFAHKIAESLYLNCWAVK